MDKFQIKGTSREREYMYSKLRASSVAFLTSHKKFSSIFWIYLFFYMKFDYYIGNRFL